MSGEFLEHEPCPECGSSDALARYSDGGAYCFSCGHHERNTERAPEEKGMTEKSTDRPMILGEHQRLGKRNLSEDTCKKFDYATGEFSGKPVQIATYRRDGKRVAQKVRFPNKDFLTLGDFKHSGLYGQHLWRNGGKRLIITEGEVDALSVSQLQENKWPVVSVPNGAQGAAKAIARELDFVESYETVVFAFDMDEPGQEAAKECAAILSPGKAHIACLPMKDANECLVAGKGRDLISALWDAKPYRPDGVVDVESLVEDALAPIEHGDEWPWPELTRLTYGRRAGELYGFGGGTGCGKSTIFKQVALHIIEREARPVGMLMLEENPKLTLKTLAGMHMRQRVHVPGVEYSEDALRAAIMDLSNKVFFYDHFGSTDWSTIKEKIRYMVRALNCRDIFLDHLTAIAASIDTDERKAIDKIMAELSALTQELGCTIYFVSHLATPDGTPHEEGGRVLEKHFRGSRSIAMWAHYLFGIERDKQDLEGVTTFRVLKDRFTGDANGLTFGLRYSKESGHLEECELPKYDDDSSPFDPSEEDF